jgi:hypothetical protein
MNVVTDFEGLLTLRAAHPGPIVRQQSDGELIVDFSANGRAGGINTDSRYQVGWFSRGFPGEAKVLRDNWDQSGKNAYTDPAFKILNQDTAPHDVTVEFDGDAADAVVYMQIDSGDNDGDSPAGNGSATFGDLLVSDGGTVAGRGSTATVYGVEPGDYAGVSIFVDTTATQTGTEAEPSIDLSATLKISASGGSSST